MANVLDYVLTRGDLSFKTRPFNEVDNIVFSLLSYYNFDGIISADYKKPYTTLAAAVEMMAERHTENQCFSEHFPDTYAQDSRLIRALAYSERFRNIRIAAYVNKIDKEQQVQFSAMTIFPKKERPCIAFRGTDSSLVGWKEDFNLALDAAVPAQNEAVNYLENAAKHFWGSFYVCGHSKGGNLAIYSASCCKPKTQKRIKAIYSNDGPGFKASFLSNAGYKNIKSKIHSFIPQGSIIGLLFEHDYDSIVVASKAAGLRQHSLWTWEVLSDSFIREPAIDEKSASLNRSIMAWINGMDNTQREQLIEGLYTILQETEIQSVSQFLDHRFSNTRRIFTSFWNADKETKQMLVKSFTALFALIGKAKLSSTMSEQEFP
ncbi:MAG: DUF2974 domain-containing protein [Spirochaetaceae bacterium]|jgi:hypothetical protein|nr:DUF2974 domain-containing protein [Spirochaetaceae bacterium]